jgi:hypothetical protein
MVTNKVPGAYCREMRPGPRPLKKRLSKTDQRPRDELNLEKGEEVDDLSWTIPMHLVEALPVQGVPTLSRFLDALPMLG